MASLCKVLEMGDIVSSNSDGGQALLEGGSQLFCWRRVTSDKKRSCHGLGPSSEWAEKSGPLSSWRRHEPGVLGTCEVLVAWKGSLRGAPRLRWVNRGGGPSLLLYRTTGSGLSSCRLGDTSAAEEPGDFGDKFFD